MEIEFEKKKDHIRIKGIKMPAVKFRKESFFDLYAIITCNYIDLV